MRQFAIGLKGWVEIRAARKPPVLSTTIIPTKRRIHKRFLRTAGWYDWKEVTVPTTVEVHAFEGGRHLRTVKATKFRKLLGISLAPWGVVELLPEQIERLKNGNKS